MHNNKPGPQSKGARLQLRPARREGERARWIILDSDPNGRRIEKSTGAFEQDRATAEKALADYLVEKHVPFAGGHPDQVLICDALNYYGQTKAMKAKRQDTIALSLVNLGKFVVEKDLKYVANVNENFCDQYIAWRIAQGDARGSNKWQRKPPTKRALKPSTAYNDLITLASAIRYCHDNGALTHLVKVTIPKRTKTRVRFLTTSEAARLLLAALGWDKHGRRHPKRINRHLARLILIGLYTGTRIDRILRLQWVENFQGGWVDLRRGMLHRRAPSEPDTNKKAPDVPLNDRLWTHMHRWRRLTARYVIEHDGMSVKNNVVTAMEGACELAGLDRPPYHPDRISPHTLRHTCVSWMLAANKSPFQVGKYVGMSAQMVESTYGHVTEHLQRETANTRRRVIR